MRLSVCIPSVVYIYGVVQSSTNELVYVGQSVNPESRMAGHRNSTVRDIKNDCHMVIFEASIDTSSEEEYFWIEYFRSLGSNLRNKKVRSSSVYPLQKARKYVGNYRVIPHLIHEMQQRNITCEQLQPLVNMSFARIVAARHGGGIDPHEAYKIERVLHLGVDIFRGLDRKAVNAIIFGTDKYIKRVQSGKTRKERKLTELFTVAKLGYEAAMAGWDIGQLKLSLASLANTQFQEVPQ